MLIAWATTKFGVHGINFARPRRNRTRSPSSIWETRKTTCSRFGRVPFALPCLMRPMRILSYMRATWSTLPTVTENGRNGLKPAVGSTQKSPGIPTPGNHEYYRSGIKRRLSVLWRPHFTLPENGPGGLAETTYYTDYQGARIISLNSNERIEEQAPWLERVLKDNPNPWTFVTFHHPAYSASSGRDNKELREAWKPLFDKYAVDMVLQGHDHAYARGHNIGNGVTVRDSTKGTVYVVSVSGPKQYKLREDPWMTRGAENTQLYQVISVSGNTLRYRAKTAVGDLYDAFDLVKQPGKPNKLIERGSDSPERRRENTLKKR